MKISKEVYEKSNYRNENWSTVHLGRNNEVIGELQEHWRKTTQREYEILARRLTN